MDSGTPIAVVWDEESPMRPSALIALCSLLLLAGCAAEERVISTWTVAPEGCAGGLEVFEAEVSGEETHLTSAPISPRDPELGSAQAVSIGLMHHDLRDQQLTCLSGPGVRRVDVWPGEEDRSWVISWQGQGGNWVVDAVLGSDELIVRGEGDGTRRPVAPGFWASLGNQLVLLLHDDGRVSIPEILHGSVRLEDGQIVSGSCDPVGEPIDFAYSWRLATEGRPHPHSGIRPAPGIK
jgi:hypothetical protein